MAPRKNRNKYSNDDLLQAVAAVKSKSMTFKQASERYGVPSATIADRTLGRYKAEILTPGKIIFYININFIRH